MNKLQTVLDALVDMVESVTGVDQVSAVNEAREAIGIVKEMMAQEPVNQYRVLNCTDWYDGFPDTSDGKHYKTRTLYAAPVSVQAVPAWLPIESAPKDGTEFLGLRGNKIANAYKVQRDDCEMWCFGGSSGDVEIAPYTKPTHWMPLPAAPKGAV